MGRKRVARLMRSVSLAGVSRRKRPHTLTVRSRGVAKAPDLVQRQFTAEAPDRLWVADITYVPTRAGFLYLAVVVDVYSRRVVGWAMESHLRTELVLQALNMALYLRRPQGVIHHSDQGIQYTTYAFGKRCSEWGVRPSWGLWATAMTMPYARASSPRWSVNSWIAGPSRPMLRLAWPSSSTSTGTTPTVDRLHASQFFERRYTSSQRVEPLTVHPGQLHIPHKRQLSVLRILNARTGVREHGPSCGATITSGSLPTLSTTFQFQSVSGRGSPEPSP